MGSTPRDATGPITNVRRSVSAAALLVWQLRASCPRSGFARADTRLATPACSCASRVPRSPGRRSACRLLRLRSTARLRWGWRWWVGGHQCVSARRTAAFRERHSHRRGQRCNGLWLRRRIGQGGGRCGCLRTMGTIGGPSVVRSGCDLAGSCDPAFWSLGMVAASGTGEPRWNAWDACPLPRALAELSGTASRRHAAADTAIAEHEHGTRPFRGGAPVHGTISLGKPRRSHLRERLRH